MSEVRKEIINRLTKLVDQRKRKYYNSQNRICTKYKF